MICFCYHDCILVILSPHDRNLYFSLERSNAVGLERDVRLDQTQKQIQTFDEK
jgi:hypothetical protein